MLIAFMQQQIRYTRTFAQIKTVKSPFFISVVLASLAALAPFAIDTYLPAFPLIAADLHSNTHALQQSLTAYLLPYCIMTLWHGAVSDSIGRLNAIKWGLGIFALASIGCALVSDVQTLWFFRALQGISAGAGNVVARAMVRDLFAGVQAQKVMAQVQMMFGIAPAVAPVIGGWLLGIHWQAIFIFLMLYALLAMFMALRYLPETIPPEKRKPVSVSAIITSYGQVFRNQQFIRLIGAVAANFAGFFIYVLAAPVFLMQHLKLSSAQFGYLFIPTVSGMILGSWLAKHWAGRLPTRHILKIGYGIMIIAVLANISISSMLPPNIWWNIPPIAIYNIGMALVLPVLSVAALDLMPQMRGTASSAQAFVQMLLSTVSAGLLVPLLWFSPLGLALGACMYLAIALLLLGRSNLIKLGEQK